MARRGTQTKTGRADWRLLEECEGFHVDGADGHVGVVEALRFDGRSRRPSALLVRAGPSSRRLLVAIERIERILPARRRIVLRSAPAEPA